MRILSYILLSSILLTGSLNASAQENAEQEKRERKESLREFFTFKGVGFSTDLFCRIYSLLGEGISTEFAAEVNLGNLLYPTVEAGWAWCNTTDENRGIKYRTNAPYYKIGFNYNFTTSKKKPNPRHYIYGLFRIGWSSFEYDVETPPITDPVWGSTVALNLKNVEGSCLWGELGVGIKVKIVKGFKMGWSVRYKVRFTEEKAQNSRMWYIPGYGINNSTGFGGTYSLIYDLPIK